MSKSFSQSSNAELVAYVKAANEKTLVPESSATLGDVGGSLDMTNSINFANTLIKLTDNAKIVIKTLENQILDLSNNAIPSLLKENGLIRNYNIGLTEQLNYWLTKNASDSTAYQTLINTKKYKNGLHYIVYDIHGISFALTKLNEGYTNSLDNIAVATQKYLTPDTDKRLIGVAWHGLFTPDVSADDWVFTVKAPNYIFILWVDGKDANPNNFTATHSNNITTPSKKLSLVKGTYYPFRAWFSGVGSAQKQLRLSWTRGKDNTEKTDGTGMFFWNNDYEIKLM